MARRRRNDGPIALGTSLQQVAGRMTKINLLGMSAIQDVWNSVVEETVALHAQPLRLDQSTLVVAVDRPVWATQIRLLSSGILSKLAELGIDGVSAVEAVVRSAEQPRS